MHPVKQQHRHTCMVAIIASVRRSRRGRPTGEGAGAEEKQSSRKPIVSLNCKPNTKVSLRIPCRSKCSARPTRALGGGWLAPRYVASPPMRALAGAELPCGPLSAWHVNIRPCVRIPVSLSIRCSIFPFLLGGLTFPSWMFDRSLCFSGLVTFIPGAAGLFLAAPFTFLFFRMDRCHLGHFRSFVLGGFESKSTHAQAHTHTKPTNGSLSNLIS